MSKPRSEHRRDPSWPGRDHPDDEAELLLQEQVDKLNAGERLDLKGLLRDHPGAGLEVIEQLKVFEGIERDDQVTPSLCTLGDYTLRRKLGRGGMGVVYEAWENSMDRAVAVKVLPAGIAADDKAVARFVQEARLAGRLNHKNVVGVYGMGVKAETPYYAMEYVHGETLAQILGRIRDAGPGTETPFGPKDQVDYFAKVARAFAQVADGLQHAHENGVIHRDIKPSNLILDAERRLRILDFGLAKLEGQESLTLSGDLVGTPAYMSPEHARRREVPCDHRTDIYSLGATLYEFLTLEPPFRGKDSQDTLSQIIEKDPRPPRQLNARIPADLETLLLKCLRKDAGDRYGTAEALGQDLRRFARGDPIEAKAQSLWEQTTKRLWRQRRLGLAVGAFLMLALVALAASAAVIAKARDAAKYDLYVSNMLLATKDLETGSFSRFCELLKAHIPEAGEPDLRGWEWYYLEGLRQQELFTLAGHTGMVHSVSWSPDGRQLISGSIDGTVRIWDVSASEEVKRLEHGAAVSAVAWSPNGRWWAAGGQKGLVRIWDANTSGEVHVLPHETRVSALAWSHDGTHLATGGSDGTVKIWNGNTFEAVRNLPRPDAAVLSLAWRPDNRVLAVGFQDQESPGNSEKERGLILLVDPSTTTVIASLKRGVRINALAWTDDDQLASGIAGPEIALWDTPASAQVDVLANLAGSKGHVSTLAQGAERRWLASGSGDGTVRIWDLSQEKNILTLRGHRGEVRSVAWNPHSNHLLASGSADGTVKVWDVLEPREPLELPATTRAAWSPCGLWLAAMNKEGQLVVFDASTGEIVQQLVPTHPAPVRSMAFSPDSRLVATARKDGILKVYDWNAKAEVLSVLAHKGQARSVTWSPDGTQLATGGSGGARVWDLNGKLMEELPKKGWVCSVAWNSDGSRFAAVGLGIWETTGWTRVHELPAPEGSGGWWSLAWSPEGDRLACGSHTSGVLTIFDAETGETLHEKRGHTALIRSLSWSPDGRRIASGGNDSTARIWDAETGRELIAFPPFRDDVLCVAWHPDGRRLMTAPTGGESIRIWDAPEEGGVAGN